MRRLLAYLAALALALPPLPAQAQQSQWLWWGADANHTAPASTANPLPVNLAAGGTLSRAAIGALPALNAKTDFGAKGDNSTNDGPALATALAACTLTTPLYLPPGRYKSRQPLTVPSGCKFFGDNIAVIYYNGGGGPQPTAVVITDDSTGGFSAGQAVVNLTDNTSAVVGIAAFGIAASSVGAFKTTAGGTLLNTLAASGIYGINCASGGVTSILYSEIADNTTGISGSCADFVVDGNYVHANGKNIYATGQIKALYANNVIEWSGDCGMDVNSTFGQTARINIVGNTFDRNWLAGICLSAVNNATITGNVFNRSNASGAGGAHISFAGANLGLQMSGNTYSASHIEDDGSGIITPDYVYTAAGGSTFSGGITDSPAPQNVGVYADSTTQAAVIPALLGGLIDVQCPNSNSATVTISIAAPGVVTSATTPAIGCPVNFTTTGALPTGLAVGTNYFVIAAGYTAGVSFEVATAPGGTAITTTGTQSGTHTAVFDALETSATVRVIQGISLPFGDWDCSANYTHNPASTTSILQASISTSTTVLTAPPSTATLEEALSFTTGDVISKLLGPWQVSNTTTTPVEIYLLSQPTFASTAVGYGDLHCRRLH